MYGRLHGDLHIHISVGEIGCRLLQLHLHCVMAMIYRADLGNLVHHCVLLKRTAVLLRRSTASLVLFRIAVVLFVYLCGFLLEGHHFGLHLLHFLPHLVLFNLQLAHLHSLSLELI